MVFFSTSKPSQERSIAMTSEWTAWFVSYSALPRNFKRRGEKNSHRCDVEGCVAWLKSGKFLHVTTRWWFQIFLIFHPYLGEMIQFDKHIFQMGWFNHQLDNLEDVCYSVCLNHWNSCANLTRFCLPDTLRSPLLGKRVPAAVGTASDQWHQVNMIKWIPQKSAREKKLNQPKKQT